MRDRSRPSATGRASRGPTASAPPKRTCAPQPMRSTRRGFTSRAPNAPSGRERFDRVGPMRRSTLFLMVALAGCGGGGGSDPDAMVPIDSVTNPDADPTMPMTLADTGLCEDAGCTQIADGIYEFAPEYILWSDGATKRRWIQLPPDAQIDTSDMDY